MRLREYNTCHDPNTGRFCSTPGAKSGAAPAKGAGRRPAAIKVNTVEEAIPLVLAGKVVELPDPRQVNTLLSRLSVMANDAKARGEQAPNYDLCNVTLRRAKNLFCGSKLRSEEYPDGVPRIEMPQFSGQPVEGSPASKLPRDKSGEVNGGAAFIEHLTKLGIATSQVRVPAARLKASQAELVGPKVAGMMLAEGWDPGAEPIFISRDHYVIDGHHRWAAVVGRDSKDGKLGDLPMNVVRVDAPITEVLHLARSWAKAFGIAGKSGPSAPKKTTESWRYFMRRV